MEFCAFDESYVDRLRAGDFRTQEHFVAYFSELIKVKLRSRVRIPEDIEDIRQETFTRVFKALRSEQGIRQPERLGAFVNATCNNVRNEYYRQGARDGLAEEKETQQDYADPTPSTLDELVTRQVREEVQQVLDDLPERDRRLIREVLLQERDKDEVCREIGVDRDYLRVLLHRAIKSFKGEYLKKTGPSKRTAQTF
jgi:RNA polymerase sigma-70 factor (ECF subfamily)